jgi:hypothetical protein
VRNQWVSRLGSLLQRSPSAREDIWRDLVKDIAAIKTGCEADVGKLNRIEPSLARFISRSALISRL